MDKMDKQIMIVKKKHIFPITEGFIHHDLVNIQQRILDNYFFIRRGDAEENPIYKQPIGYVVVIHPETKQVHVYSRSKDSNKYAEERLRGLLSIGFGGHIEQEDVQEAKQKGRDPILEGTIRELFEEGEIRGSPKILGYLYSEATSVDKDHFGIVYIIESPKVGKGDGENEKGKFINIEELEKLVENPPLGTKLETWSELLVPHIREYLILN